MERGTNMRTWNFGIVGAGLVADFHARAVNDIPQAKLIGFCDSGSGNNHRQKINIPNPKNRRTDSAPRLSETMKKWSRATK